MKNSEHLRFRGFSKLGNEEIDLGIRVDEEKELGIRIVIGIYDEEMSYGHDR
jgi:hypothetical protein